MIIDYPFNRHLDPVLTEIFFFFFTNNFQNQDEYTQQIEIVFIYK